MKTRKILGHNIAEKLDKLTKSPLFQVIRRQDHERSDWSLFIKPISNYMWLALVFHSLVIVVILKVLWWHYNKRKLLQRALKKIKSGIESLKYYIMFSSSYFGRSINELPHQQNTSIQVNALSLNQS